MVADTIYDDVKTHLEETGGAIGKFFAQAAKDKMAIIKAPPELRGRIEELVKEARALLESGPAIAQE